MKTTTRPSLLGLCDSHGHGEASVRSSPCIPEHESYQIVQLRRGRCQSYIRCSCGTLFCKSVKNGEVLDGRAPGMLEEMRESHAGEVTEGGQSARGWGPLLAKKGPTPPFPTPQPPAKSKRGPDGERQKDLLHCIVHVRRPERIGRWAGAR